MVKRYDMWSHPTAGVRVEERNHGSWVKYEDLAPLLAVAEAGKKMRELMRFAMLSTTRDNSDICDSIVKFDKAISRIGKDSQ